MLYDYYIIIQNKLLGLMRSVKPCGGKKVRFRRKYYAVFIISQKI